VERAGVPPEAVDDLPATAARAGLDVVSSLGTFTVLQPEVGFELHASTLAAVRDRATELGVASVRDIDRLIASLQGAAEAQPTAWVTTPTYLDLVLRKPA
jgi:hypothetical protein